MPSTTRAPAGQLPLRGAALEVAVRREDVAHRVEPALERLLGRARAPERLGERDARAALVGALAFLAVAVPFAFWPRRSRAASPARSSPANASDSTLMLLARSGK